MARLSPESGRRSPITHRLGVDVPRWRGENSENDGGGLMPDEFREAINVRILPNGMIVNRGGQERSIEDAMDDCVNQIIDDEVHASRLLIGLSKSNGGEPDIVYSFDPNNTDYNDDVLFDSFRQVTQTVVGRCMAYCVHEGRWYFTVTSDPAIVATVDVYSMTKADLYGGRPATLVVSLPDFGGAGNYIAGSLVSSGGLLWIGASRMDSGAGTMRWRIFSYEAATGTLTLSDTVDHVGNGFGVPYLIVDHDGNLFAAMRYQNIISSIPSDGGRALSAGVWSTIALPGGVLTNWQTDDMVVHDGATYLAGIGVYGVGRGYVLKWSGGALTVATGPFELPTRTVTSLASFDGKLYYYISREEPSGGDSTVLGQFDGSTWNDSFVDMAAKMAGHGSPPGAGCYVRAIRDRLRLIGDTDGVAIGCVWSAETADPSGVWNQTSVLDSVDTLGGILFITGNAVEF